MNRNFFLIFIVFSQFRVYAQQIETAIDSQNKTTVFIFKKRIINYHHEITNGLFLLRKTPLVNKLIIGANTLSTKEHKPYSELYVGLNNIGFGNIVF